MKIGMMGLGNEKSSFYYLLRCHEKQDVFSFLGFLGKLNEDIFIFKNYLFVPLIVGRRFLGKKYNKILSGFDYYFHVFGDFFHGVFFKPNFMFLPPLLVFYPIKH